MFNGFWIAGAALLLAAFSYHHWLSGNGGEPLGRVLRRPSFQRLFWLAMALITTGLTGISESIWERFLWAVFTLVCLVNGYQAGLFTAWSKPSSNG